MKKNGLNTLFRSVFLLLLLVSLALTSCSKKEQENITTEIEEVMLFPENSEEIIDGELFIDGVSQKEVITDFDIDGVQVIDGRLAFENHDALMDATHKLAEYNTESVVAWSHKIGFTSLFTELTRIEEKPLEEIKEALNQGMNKEYFHISERGYLELSKHSPVHARIYNTQGLIQVGEFVGTMSSGLNVWVKSDKVEKLVNALIERYIPDNDRDFIVVNKEAFEMDRNWIALETCPKNDSWLGPVNQYKNPTANRRIDVQNEWENIITPLSNGNFDSDFRYWVYTTSRKSANNKYKTNHYLSIDIRTRAFLPDVFVRQNTDVDTNTKYGNILNHIDGLNNASFSAVITNKERLLETIPGSSGMTGTAGSHQGMGARYGRQDCD